MEAVAEVAAAEEGVVAGFGGIEFWQTGLGISGGQVEERVLVVELPFAMGRGDFVCVVEGDEVVCDRRRPGGGSSSSGWLV